MKLTKLLGLVMALAATAINVQAHGTISDPVSRVRTIFLDGPDSPSTPSAKAAIAKAGQLPYYTWNQISQNIPNYADPEFNTSYATVIPDGKLASGNNTGQGALDFSGLDLVSNDWDWPATSISAGEKEITWIATAPHDPSFFKVWITKSGYDPKKPLAWGDLEFLGKFDPSDYTKDGLLYKMKVNIPQRTGRHVLYVAWQRVDPVGEVFFSTSDVIFNGANTGGGGNTGGNTGGSTGGNTGGGSTTLPVATINNASVVENQGSVSLTVSLNKAVEAGKTASFNYVTNNGSATAPSDFTASNGTVSFAAGETTKTITVPIIDDAIYESTENFFLSFSGATNLSLAAASSMVSIVDNDPNSQAGNTRKRLPRTTKIVAGYWHNWNNASAPAIRLANVSPKYNVVYISFAEPTAADDGTMKFSPSSDVPGAAQFKEDVRTLQARGTKVLLSLGGANGHVTLSTEAKKQNFINSMKQIIEEYNFDGFDIDIEGGASLAIDAGDNDYKNPTTGRIVNFISATREICDHFGNEFMLTSAPETAYVQGAASNYGGSWGGYIPIIHALRDKLDYVHVQYYNSGSIFGADGRIYTQGSVDFLVGLSESLLNGFTLANGQKFIPLRQDQVAFGLPATPSAAPAGGYVAMDKVVTAIKYITTGDKAGSGYQGNYTLQKTTGGYPEFRGTMAWSINWDKTTNGGTAVNEYVDTISAHYGSATDSSGSGNGLAKIQIAPYSTPEGNVNTTELRLSVTLSKANDAVTTVDYSTVNGTALAGSDYQAKSGTITFAPGETMKHVTVNVYGDTDIEADETLTVQLSNSSANAEIQTASAIGTIINDDVDKSVPAVTVTGASVIEGNTGTKTARVRLALNAAFTDEVTVDYATADDTAKEGSDYVKKTGTTTFGIGETEKFVDITINGDTEVEVNELFSVNFSNPKNATLSNKRAVVTIINDDTNSGGNGGDGSLNVSITFKQPTNSWSNGFGGADIVITNNGPAITNWTLAFNAPWGRGTFWNAGSWTVENNRHSITNPAWAGYTLGTGETLTIGFTGTGSWTHPTNITFNGSAIGGGGNGGNGDNGDPTPPNITVADASVVEGNNGTKTLTATVSLSKASTQTVALNYATEDGSAKAGSDYVASSGNLSFAPGEVTKTVTLTVNGDTTVEPDEIFYLKLSNAVNGAITDDSATLTISNDDSAPASGNNGLTVQFKQPTTTWSGAFGGADIVITNNGQTAVANWKLEFEATWSKQGFWNAGSWTTNGNQHTITNPSWGTIQPGQSVTVGFTGTGVWSQPKNVKITKQ